MNFLPLPADRVELRVQFILETRQFAPAKTIILTQADPAFPAMNLKNRLAPIADDVHMRWSMVIDIDHNP